MRAERRLILTAAAGVAVLLAGAGADLLAAGFWQSHALIASLLANLLVVAVTVVVINEVLDRRDHRRWSLLAQSVLFALIQTARATWTALVEELRLAEVESGALEPLRDAADATTDWTRVSEAARALLADDARRQSLQRLCLRLGEHASEVIAKWAPVMVNARPYTALLDRHAELAGRLEWLSSMLMHNEPPPGLSSHDRAIARSSVATERAEELGSEDWLHDQMLAVVRLAVELDHDSRELAFELAPMQWWTERTTDLAESEPDTPAPAAAAAD